MTIELKCGCDKKLLPLIEKGNNIQTAIFTFPEIDVALALKFANEWTDKQINDMLDVFEGWNVYMNPMFQFLYNGLEIYTSDEIVTILETKLEHRKHD